MAIPAFRFALASTALLLVTMSASPTARAQCGCPSGGGDAPTSSNGLGEPMPDAIDLASDPAWQVYAFERDGIRYLQINDSAHQPRAAIGQIGPTAWVLPIGLDADRVRIEDGVRSTTARLVYRDERIEVLHDLQSGQDRWLVRPAASEY